MVVSALSKPSPAPLRSWHESGTATIHSTLTRPCLQILIWHYPDTQRPPLVVETEHQANIFGVKFLPATRDTQLVSGAPPSAEGACSTLLAAGLQSWLHHCAFLECALIISCCDVIPHPCTSNYMLHSCESLGPSTCPCADHQAHS